MKSNVVLVTTKQLISNKYRIESSLSGINWHGVDTLVFHSCSDTDVSVTLELNKLKNSLKKIIYISADLNSILYCIFRGMNADIYDDETYLYDESILDFIIDNYKETGMTIKSDNEMFDELAKGISAVAEGNIDILTKLIESPVWKRTLDNALTQVDNALVRSEAMNTEVVTMLSDINSYIDDLVDRNAKTSAKIEDLMEEVKKYEANNDFSNGIRKPANTMQFPSYAVPVGCPRVLYIKLYAPCMYLNSFLRAYQDYLLMLKQKKAKVLLVHQKVELMMRKYKDIPRLAMDSVNMMNLNSDFYITFEPYKMVLDAFFKQTAELYIVIDYLYSREPLLKGHQVKTLYGVSGISDIKLFNLQPDRVISSHIGVEGSYIIPKLRNYISASESGKLQLYSSACSELYAKLDKLLDIK